MGTTIMAILAYGYDLGGESNGWLVEEYSEEEGLVLPWFTPNDDDDYDFETAAEERLLKAHGFVETDWKVDGFFARQRAAKEAIGVGLRFNGASDYFSYILAAYVKTSYLGECEVIEPRDLTSMVLGGRFDEKLAAAIKVLGITPKQSRPEWLLASYRG